MRKLGILASVMVIVAGIGASGVMAQGVRSISERLIGYQEVPSVSTPASGEFRARISNDEKEIAYELSYRDLEAGVTQAHIHFGQRGVNGGISVFLCSNLGNGPAGTQPCPPSPATVRGTIRESDVIGPAAQGIAPGEFVELIRAIRAGVTYANVHSTKYPGGEIRAQIDTDNRGRDGDDRGRAGGD